LFQSIALACIERQIKKTSLLKSPQMKVLVIFGTRPEAIKMAPVIRELRKYSEIQCRVCVTAQHREMLDQVLDIFDTKPDYDLNLMKCNQNLSDTTATVLKAVEKVLINEKPDLILVQGDTTTTFASSLAAFYQKIKIVMNYISHKIQSNRPNQ